TRYTVLLRNNDRKSRPLMNGLINEMSPLPTEARRSITFDRGFEFMSCHMFQGVFLPPALASQSVCLLRWPLAGCLRRSRLGTGR
ncbi:hypothetical protein V8352_17350, partial [Roseovarius sp. D0-M9]